MIPRCLAEYQFTEVSSLVSLIGNTPLLYASSSASGGIIRFSDEESIGAGRLNRWNQFIKIRIPVLSLFRKGELNGRTVEYHALRDVELLGVTRCVTFLPGLVQ